MLIYVLSPDVRTAIRLSSVNRRQHAIWLDKCEHIARTILEPEIPAHGDAAELAKMEVKAVTPDANLVWPFDKNSSGSSSKTLTEPEDNIQVPVHKWLPRLLQNADLSATACALNVEFQQERDSTCYSWKMNLTPWPT